MRLQHLDEVTRGLGDSLWGSLFGCCSCLVLFREEIYSRKTVESRVVEKTKDVGGDLLRLHLCISSLFI